MTERPRLIAATARLDAKPRKPTRRQRLRQQTEVKAWERKAEPKQAEPERK